MTRPKLIVVAAASRMGFAMALCLIAPIFAAAQNAPGVSTAGEAQKCAALINFNLENAPGGPAVITSAHVVDVPPPVLSDES